MMIFANVIQQQYRKEFDSELIYNKKILNTKIRSYGLEATDFHEKEMPKVDSNYILLVLT